MKYCILIIGFCLVNSAIPERAPATDEVELAPENAEDFGMPSTGRVKRDLELANESPVRVGFAGEKLLDGVTRIASHLPQITQDGRHFRPSIFSLTNQIGLQGVNDLVNDVVNYERTRALAVARDASCMQRLTCLLSQNVANVRNALGTLTEEQELMRSLDCNKVYAGCMSFE